MKKRQGLLVVALLIGVAPAVDAEAAEISGRPRVVDGDGLVFGRIVVRLHGVDAPESGQFCPTASGGDWDCGRAAAAALAAMVDETSVNCTALDQDRYGRVVARCLVGGEDIAGRLVDLGLAWAFVRFSTDYAEGEARARMAGVGVWQAETEPAWKHRARRWSATAAIAPAKGCPIKGNINAEGERIYHTPWSPFYERTRIDEAAGERWFCDEAGALEAGWRPARF